eukprot:scaffold503_cov375-Pinguiococcus_pyrenoidosus.AAC.10
MPRSPGCRRCSRPYLRLIVCHENLQLLRVDVVIKVASFESEEVQRPLPLKHLFAKRPVTPGKCWREKSKRSGLRWGHIPARLFSPVQLLLQQELQELMVESLRTCVKNVAVHVLIWVVLCLRPANDSASVRRLP